MKLAAILLASTWIALAGCNTTSDNTMASPGPVAASAEMTAPLGEGDRVPAVSLTKPDGRPIMLDNLVAQKPTLIVFYRGGWCPYCMGHLSQLATIEPDLVEMGYQILAISPDSPAQLRQTVIEKEFAYQLLSDSDVQAARGFGLAFRVEDQLVSKYLNEYDIDLEASSGRSHHVLPVPAVYVVDTSGMIRFAHVDPNYKERLGPEKILSAARQAK